MSEKPVDILNVKMQIRHLYIAVDFFIINNAGRKGDGVGLDDSWFSLGTVMGIHGSLSLYIYISNLLPVKYLLNFRYLLSNYYLLFNKE
jgi:carbon starvation protein CstA